MLMEDAMTHYTETDNTDHHTLYVLLISLAATVLSLPATWYFTAAAATGLVA